MTPDQLSDLKTVIEICAGLVAVLIVISTVAIVSMLAEAGRCDQEAGEDRP